MRPYRSILTLLILAATPVLAQPSPVTVSLAPNGPTVGDPVEATITLEVPDLAADPRFPVWGKTWGEAEIVKADPPARVTSTVWQQKLTLAAFKTGQVALTPVQIAIPRKSGTVQAFTPAGLAIAVQSVIPQSEKNPKPKPAAAMRPIPLGLRFWWTVAALSALCLIGLWLVYLQSRRRAAAAGPARPALGPFEELVAEIEGLRAEPSVLAVHTRLSFAIRRYLGRRLPFPAVESTTSEVQRQLLSRRMPGPVVRQTVELLRSCDLVKFARQDVGESLARERAEAARRIGGDFEAQLAPPLRNGSPGEESGMSPAIPHLASPAWLLLLLALPLLAWLHHRRQALGALTYSRLPRAGGSRGAVRLHLPFYTRLLALACLVLALARPQLGYAWEESLTEGIDIQLVLDISGSMGAEDFQPKDRLTVAKQVVRDFIAGRPGDRIGLIVFSGAALTRAPLTTDRAMLDLLVDSVQLNSLPDGTAIGVALASAAARLKASESKTKVVVLVTDGVNNAGAIDPASSAAVCAGLGIKVYTVGVGSGGRVPVRLPVQDPVTGRTIMKQFLMNVPVDEPLMRQIAARTGGQFFKATDGESLQRIFHEIDRLEKTPLRVKRYVRYREVFPPLVWAGLGFLLLPMAAAGLKVTAQP